MNYHVKLSRETLEAIKNGKKHDKILIDGTLLTISMDGTEKVTIR